MLSPQVISMDFVHATMESGIMLELREARVLEFFKKINANFGRRWAWSWNTPLDASSVDDAMKVSYQLISIKKTARGRKTQIHSLSQWKDFLILIWVMRGSFLLFWYIPDGAGPMSEWSLWQGIHTLIRTL